MMILSAGLLLPLTFASLWIQQLPHRWIWTSQLSEFGPGSMKRYLDFPKFESVELKLAYNSFSLPHLSIKEKHTRRGKHAKHLHTHLQCMHAKHLRCMQRIIMPICHQTGACPDKHVHLCTKAHHSTIQ